MSGLNLKPGYLFAVTSILLSFLSGSDGIACLNCGRVAADLLHCSTIVECNPDEACYVDRTLTTLGGSPQFSAGCRRISTCANQNLTTGDAVCSQCCYSDMCNMRGCGSDFYGDPRSVLKCYGCGDIAVGDKCPDIAQCDKTLESCVIKHGATGKALGCIKSATCRFLYDHVYSHQPPETWDVKCCDTNLCNWDTWNLNRTVIHPVHGGWSTWSPWSNCDVTCASGHVTRKRTCSNPAPENGGNNCPGVAFETQNCTRPECPIDGGWDIWTSWSHCSVTCGHGNMTRTRACAKPPPSHGGNNCTGQHVETNTCTEPACPIYGNWSNWSSWSTCDVTCANGHVTRTRTCTNPAPAHGGLTCVGDNSQKNTCTQNPCPGENDCDFESADLCSWQNVQGDDFNWVRQHSSTPTDDTGPEFDHSLKNASGFYMFIETSAPRAQNESARLQSPLIKPQKEITQCFQFWYHMKGSSIGQLNVYQSKGGSLPGDLVWSLSGEQGPDWSMGRVPVNASTNYQMVIEGKVGDGYLGDIAVDDVSFTDGNCQPVPLNATVHPVNGAWTTWSSWSSCDVTCGNGESTRTRTCSHPAPAQGGHNCNGDDIQTTSCTMNPCSVDGSWSDWTSWSNCDVTCGDGHAQRTRTCSNPAPSSGGRPCSGLDLDRTRCSTGKTCPVDGGWTSWIAWTGCDVTCGAGYMSRDRNCSNPVPKYGGSNCGGTHNETKSCTLNPCPVDGGWTSWTTWSGCDGTCDTGHMIRERNCSNPVPKYGGSECSGTHNESKVCTLSPCPVNGAWTTWSSWLSCDVTCGNGKLTRTRTCSYPAPAHGGYNCTGDDKQTTPCTMNPCPVDGSWSDWTSWSNCDVTCGDGHAQRTRTCANPAPSSGGRPCSGLDLESTRCSTGKTCPAWSAWFETPCSVTCGTGSKSRLRHCSTGHADDCTGSHQETVPCTQNPCSVDGGWTSWIAWTGCDVTCGAGYMSRDRNCSNPVPKYGGSDCSGTHNETKSCTLNSCPVDGGWTSWTTWSGCDVTCDTGHVIRERNCSNPVPKYGGSECSGTHNETKVCTLNPCPVNGAWTTWSSWLSCDVTCGNGKLTRTRTCSHPAPAHGGYNCTGDDKQTTPCTMNPCPVDGSWSNWTSWSNCDVTCGDGHAQRTRTCANPAPSSGGRPCSGLDLESTRCSTGKTCPAWSAWFELPCSLTCGTGSKSRLRHCSTGHADDCTGSHQETVPCTQNPCSVDGGWTSWIAWTECDVTCGAGYMSRDRNCSNPVPKYGGSDCSGTHNETQSCTLSPCPVDGGWTSWTTWSGCDATCEIGNVFREKNCSNPVPKYGGSDCTGSHIETKSCTLNPCPVDGGWTSWTTWSGCDVTCGTGHVTRGRNCSNPVPKYGGGDCSGTHNETKACTLNPCPVDGGWTLWTTWSGCDVTCGTGHVTRGRNCSNPVPKYGGSDCSGTHNETKACTLNPCPVDGGWTLWTTWSGCDVTCGTGHLTRGRNCSNPVPKYGGSDCSGTHNETKACTLNPCPVDGGWTSWTTWSGCDVTCGTGHVTRGRNCSNPVPKYGGSDCSGTHNETKSCTLNPCPVDGGWTSWTTWSGCDVTCGTGHVTRGRSCSNPVPKYGGGDCSGTHNEIQSCTLNKCPEWSPWFYTPCDVTCGTGSRSKLRSCSTTRDEDCSGNAYDTESCNLQECSSLDSAAILGCDFDNKTLCHWSNVLISDAIDWSIQPSDHTQILSDHKSSSGSFIILNKTSAVPKGAKAVLKSAELPPSTGDCLQFWYIAKGVDIGEITVYIHTDTNTKTRVWSLGNGHVTGWELGNATLKSENSHFHVSFEGVIGDGISGYLALDDITMVNGDCVLPVHHSNTAALIG
ncbi:SCO-spondin-like isoform X8 [Dreissena polymorpha]|uniref:SCO-spondin-like isoform X6 n=1 Tax=Dreissena polymorpha TaxID=45954 RepID=UPI0022647EDA|nr:SCO-spondin-like isoform X6 [Dreissena polymorpha]XP_052220186.1 SCO-spondin-like isoform X8 [Dreissena polymorpha]